MSRIPSSEQKTPATDMLIHAMLAQGWPESFKRRSGVTRPERVIKLADGSYLAEIKSKQNALYSLYNFAKGVVNTPRTVAA